MLFGLVICFCAVFALVAADSPRLSLGAVFGAYIFLPFTGVGRVYIGGTGVGLHTATILVLMLAFVRLVMPRSSLTVGNSVTRLPAGVYGLIAVFLVGAFVSQWTSGTAPAASAAFMLNQIIAPFLFFVLCVDANRRDAAILASGMRIFVVTGVVQSVIAMGVATRLLPQPYITSYSANWWWRQEFLESGRQVGTLDTPLNLGLFLAACVPLVLVFKSTSVRSVFGAILITGIFLTQSRIGLVAAALAIVYIVLFGVRRLGTRIAVVLAVVLGYFALSRLGLVGTFLARVANDRGSSEARSLAWQYLLPRWADFLVTGHGVFAGKSYLTARGFSISAESAIFSYSISFGLIFTVCYFGAVVWLIAFAVKREGRVTAPTLSAMLVVASIQLYSSIATESSAAYILWTVLFFAVGRATSVDERVGSPMLFGSATPPRSVSDSTRVDRDGRVRAAAQDRVSGKLPARTQLGDAPI